MTEEESRGKVSKLCNHVWGREIEPYDETLLVETVKNGNHVTNRNSDGTITNNWVWSEKINYRTIMAEE